MNMGVTGDFNVVYRGINGVNPGDYPVGKKVFADYYLPFL
jgi:hypothetical protein